MCKLSIITINYNNAKGLQKTIQSVLSQTLNPYEWIIVDGGSKDSSIELISQISHILSHLVSEPDTGVYNAMNKGINLATGDYIQFLNSGDIYHDCNVIEDFCSRNNTEDVIYGKEIGIDIDGNEIWRWELPALPLRFSFFWNNTIRHQATFFKRSCFDKFRYNEQHKINSDSELYMQLYYHGYSFGQFDRFITIFATDGISSSKKSLELIQEEFRESISSILPQGMLLDYEELMAHRRWDKSDIETLTKKISNSGKLFRYLIRFPLYSINCLLDLHSFFKKIWKRNL